MRSIFARAAAIAALATAIPAMASAQNFVQNGGFETGNFTGWTQGGNTGYTGVTCGSDAHSGNCAGSFGPVGSYGTLSQTFSDNAGEQLTFSFFVRNTGSSNNGFEAYFNGTQLLSLINQSETPYTQYSFDVTGTGSDAISFNLRNDPMYTYLDDVSVVSSVSTTPEPSSMALLGTGLVGLVPMVRRRRK